MLLFLQGETCPPLSAGAGREEGMDMEVVVGDIAHGGGSFRMVKCGLRLRIRIYGGDI